MAVGDLKDAASANSLSTLSSNVLTMGGVTANIGDLVYALFAEEIALTVSGVTDNLGNTYTALSVGTDAGTITARTFYSRLTIGGPLTTLTFAATNASANCAYMAALFAGPVGTLDRNPGNQTTDILTPFNTPFTGGLAQPDELVIGWGAANYNATWGISAPGTLQVQATTTGVIGAIASKVVAATTSVAASFTCGTNPTEIVLGISSFRAPVIDTITVTKATVTVTGKTVTIRDSDLIPVAKATATVTGQTVTVSGDIGVIPVSAAAVALIGKTVTDVDISTPGDSVVVIEGAALVLRGKSIITIGTIPVDQASVTFAGKSVTDQVSTFQDIPKYIIRGRGSRHELWTQGSGGTIKGRGSRAFLVMQ